MTAISPRASSALVSLVRTCAVAAALVALTVSGARAQGTLPGGLRGVVARNAPFIIAETRDWDYPSQAYDQIIPVDFDGDNDASNNAANAALATSSWPGAVPKVYFSIHENSYASDSGYDFVGYYWYHARDDGFRVNGVEGAGHEHDMEGVWMIIKKSPYLPYGVIAVATSQAHGAMIPFLNPSQSLVSVGNPAGAGGYQGFVEFWTDPRYGSWQRPVVGIRSSTHGSYFAQDCSGKSFPLDAGYGMWRGSWEERGGYTACIHDDGNWMLYQPMLEGGSSSSALALDQRTGTHTYALQELVQTPLWSLRSTPGALFGGSLNDIRYGAGYGFDTFRQATGDGSANTPWSWRGGSACLLGLWAWYSFGYDDTAQHYSCINWFSNPAPGELISQPTGEARNRFPSLPQLEGVLRYNPYVSSPPDYATQAFSAGIGGPSLVGAGETNTWTAYPAGGTPGYTFQWSGALTGTGASITGQLYSSAELYLDVWDAMGRHVAVSYFVNVNNCPPPAISC